MDLGLWYGFWSGVLCGLWFGAGVTVLKLRQEAKRRGWRILSANPTLVAQRAYGLASDDARRHAAGPNHWHASPPGWSENTLTPSR
jgi:hypothetical protein